MYVNWTPRLRRYIINQWKLGITPISEIARNRHVPRGPVYYMVERWFGTYKQEYDERFSGLNDFIDYYNEERLHQGIGYLAPLEKYKSAK